MVEVKIESAVFQVGTDIKYATPQSDGVDLRANIKYGDVLLIDENNNKYNCSHYDSVTLPPKSRALIPTGIRLEIPDGYRAQIYTRSGLALKEGIIVLNAPGKIDSDYRGELGIILYNTTNQPFEVTHGDRIAQLSLEESLKMSFISVDHIESETERSSGGFGHTGVK